MKKIAIIGIAGESVFLSVDKFGVTGETIQAADYRDELGGKGFNQAIAAVRCGAEVSFLCACYRGDVERFTEIAESKGLNSYFIGKETRSPYAVITTDKNGDNRVLVYRGAELDKKDVELFAEQIKIADVLLINNEVPTSVNQKAAEIAGENRVKIILNPAPSRNYERDFLDKIDLFTPNEHETEGLDGRPNVIVTLGERGCLIRKTGEIVPSAKMGKVVDTTGAGDTFNGVLAASIADGKDLSEAVKTAVKAAGIKVTRKGIINAIPFGDEYKES
ncbi:MAG: ribokinase [Clostridia bacterium]|nr:ribokinase [Clostridia bacterium]